VTARTQDAAQLKALQVGALTKYRSIESHHGRAAISRSPDSGLMTRPGALGYFRLRRNVWSGLIDCLRTAFRAVEGALTKFRSIELHHGRAVISLASLCSDDATRSARLFPVALERMDGAG